MTLAIRTAFPLVVLLAACSATAQQPAPEITIKTEQLAPGVAVIFGQGGNIGVSYGADGTVLIDDQFAPLTPKIQAAVSSLGATPVKFLINTHWHGDHTGGNENLGKAGALILAHDNVRIRLLQAAAPGTTKAALPVVTYDKGLNLHLNGDRLRAIYSHGGHTDGDTIIVWQNANIVHMGDLFMNKVSLPYLDLKSGASATNLLASVEEALKQTNAATKIIPGHGPVGTQADLIAWRDMLKSVIGSVQASIKAKRTLAQIQAAKPAAKWEVKGGFISGDAFTEAVYKSLTASVAKTHAH
jgi:glyoxylase-like metal-dependent hydrolase (beta-lactamase superfamily II)